MQARLRAFECQRDRNGWFAQPEPELSPESLLSDEKWLAEVEEEKRLIESLPVVKGSVQFGYSEKTSDNKVWVTVWCCWQASNGSFKQIKDNCDEKGGKPTHLEVRRATC
jgi:hypothetical protein